MADAYQRLCRIGQEVPVRSQITFFHRLISCLHQCLTHEEEIIVLNDFHTGACGGHLFGLATAQKILRAGYF